MRREDPDSHRITHLWRFKSTKKSRWYIVEIECFGEHLIAIKFYPKNFRLSEQRYSLMTNDNEPRTIVSSCLYVVKHYLDKDPLLSFGFVAAQDIDEKKRQRPVNRRFSFYQRMVVSFFGTKTFNHFYDEHQRVYLLINNDGLKKKVISAGYIEELLNELYAGEFNFSWD